MYSRYNTTAIFILSGVSGCNTSTIGYFPSIFATIEGSCSDDEDDDVMQAEVE